MPEAKKTSSARKRTTAAKAAARKPAPGESDGTGPGRAVPSVPLVASVPLVPDGSAAAAPASPVDLGAELSLPFEQIIGGPLQGVIRSSAMAANETAQFIKSVGFKQDGHPETVAFSYTSTEPTQTDGTTGKNNVVRKVEVPLLTVVPIPYLQLSKVTLDFNVKIDSVSTRKQEQKIGAETSASGGFWGVKASLKASYDSSSSSSETVSRSASMSVHVEAEQGPMPGGMEKILSMLTDNAVTVKPDGS
ncbi:DUF2589 domain-containing protein [Streptomyces sp. WI03-4A]|uniref:DUF2589 domain-containing protein n=1 Tax=Streptomyces TaxID=1883 RepID=UPI0029B8DD15|nr:DUF2589 domain-containing protein [Streptomyces sp. WI03-4A]MDX2591386.1 DUF2589 domain-containing protein [Streptomyces sp. WI03-4A]